MNADVRAAVSGFDELAEDYDRTRPVCPPAMFDDLVALTGLSAGDRVLEIGCGTGQATVPLAERGSPLPRLTGGEPGRHRPPPPVPFPGHYGNHQRVRRLAAGECAGRLGHQGPRYRVCHTPLCRRGGVQLAALDRSTTPLRQTGGAARARRCDGGGRLPLGGARGRGAVLARGAGETIRRWASKARHRRGPRRSNSWHFPAEATPFFLETAARRYPFRVVY